ncbi:hypothetical protein HU200_027571 [Digitaria exilis]|uniref:HMA domain-containing protein n=1 Tax=Digitaria exilis TaxID=1010633 RepID=A0A835C5I7_9POAL|nr:hypothetical protein HU200_027571 [Digitaria exilis]
MTCDKCRRKALALAGSTYGVISVAIEGDDRDQLVVIGDGVDATNLTNCLRKTVKVGRADIITVEPVTDEKPASTTPEGEAAGEPVVWYPQGYHPGYGYYCPRTGAFYPYAGGHCYVDDPDDGPGCTIM